MVRFHLLLLLIFIINICNLTKKASLVVDAKFFEYDLPNRTVTICPSYSLISLECPQIPSLLDRRSWQPNLPKYLISIDYIRSFPLRLGFDASSCQSDSLHACNNYDLRYINSLCNGRPQCSDISAYQIRDRSLCAFKAVTEIGFHCVPTWNLNEVQTRSDICKNSSLTNDYGFIHSRNYPSKSVRLLCSTIIYTVPNHKTFLYFVNGELNHDQLRIESVTADGITILNVTLNGNLTTQRLAASTYKMKITFIPSPIYSYHPTYYLLYFYTVPMCSITDPCVYRPSPYTSPHIIFPISTIRTRLQSIGWTRVPNIWIVIPIILAYILLLLLIVALALLLQRRRKQKKTLGDVSNTNISSPYMDASGTSSRVQLVPSLSPLNGNSAVIHDTYLPRHRSSISQSFHRPLSSSSFAQNKERYNRESKSEFDLHHSGLDGIDYRHHASIPYRVRSTTFNGNYRGYGTIDPSSFSYDVNRHRRSLPKSFSDCNLCKRRATDEEYQQYFNGHDDNWHLESNLERRAEPRTYRDKIKERFRERSTTRPNSENDGTTLPPSATTIEYTTVLPRQQRIASESIRSNGPVHHLPFEYIPNENSNHIRQMEFRRSSSQNCLPTGNIQQHPTSDESGTSNFTMKFYERDGDHTKPHHDRYAYDEREVQEMSMRMNQQQNFNRHQYYRQQQQQQQKRFTDNTSEI
ncbi:unnamed protein product [Rotaria socialis]|uniref:CUB domain-containing protein n=1 Tax=Rotaria socialis TaxID=392032 RepID=A0A820W5F8_9BILA|nr:unnamed protein product [Rotaria socialis]CAF4511879.1 unnamed protein product [Rotaria socialis]